MRIDSHTHLGRKHIVATADQLVASMDKAGIDKALVFAGYMNNCSTDDLVKELAPFKGRLYGIGTASIKETLDHGYIEQLEKYLADGQIGGIKFYTGYDHYHANSEMMRVFYRLLVKYKRPAIFHSGDCYNQIQSAKLKYSKNALDIDDLATDMPDLKIVIAHCGFPWTIDTAEVCYKNKNVYADVSGFVYGKFDGNSIRKFDEMMRQFVDIAGTGKLIFGSDWPISDQESYVEVMNDNQYVYEDPDIMGKRVAQLFGIG